MGNISPPVCQWQVSSLVSPSAERKAAASHSCRQGRHRALARDRPRPGPCRGAGGQTGAPTPRPGPPTYTPPHYHCASAHPVPCLVLYRVECGDLGADSPGARSLLPVPGVDPGGRLVLVVDEVDLPVEVRAGVPARGQGQVPQVGPQSGHLSLHCHATLTRGHHGPN